MLAIEPIEECVICKQPIEASPKATLGEKGSASINKASELRNETLFCTPGQHVHQECRRNYCKPDQIAKARRLGDHKDVATCARKQILRSAERQFNFSTDCFYCGQPVSTWRKRKGSDVLTVRTVETNDTILGVCEERGDVWASAVQARILHVHDLHAADAVYHRVCSVNFRTKKRLPASYEHAANSSKRMKLGRPEEKERTAEVARFLEENDDEQITINDLIQRMEDSLANTKHHAYSYPHMQQEHFGERIIQTEINGKPNVVTFVEGFDDYCH